MITPSVVRTGWKQRYPPQKQTLGIIYIPRRLRDSKRNELEGAIIKKIASFRHKTQKFFFFAGSQSEFFGQETRMALGQLADQPCQFSKIQRAPF
jgi:hypothetical protein